MSTALFLIVCVQSQGTGPLHSIMSYHTIGKLSSGQVVFQSYSNSEP